jgi:hypothetical protein
MGAETDRLRDQITGAMERASDNGSVGILMQWLDMLDVIEWSPVVQAEILRRTEVRHTMPTGIRDKVQALGQLVHDNPNADLPKQLREVYVMLNALFCNEAIAQMCLPVIVSALRAAVEEKPITLSAFEEIQAQICEYYAVTCQVSGEEN